MVIINRLEIKRDPLDLYFFLLEKKNPSGLIIIFPSHLLLFLGIATSLTVCLASLGALQLPGAAGLAWDSVVML